MKLPEHAPSTFDRVSTREELFQVLKLLGGFEEPQNVELASEFNLLASLETEPTVFPAEPAEELSASEEQFLMEVETFDSLLHGKVQRVN
jgi:hypothetical protein